MVDPLCALPDDGLSFLLFPVEQPQFFDAVCTADEGRVLRIQVKQQNASSNWIWGASKMPGAILHGLHTLWWNEIVALNISARWSMHGWKPAAAPWEFELAARSMATVRR